jgi:predicted enzyme involved in methoxymalonyl-ACP biosynthesis
VSDRFGDHGLVGAAVVIGDDIAGLVMSCRVLGLGVEHRFVQHIIAALRPHVGVLTGRIVVTNRNIPVRHIYSDNGFSAAPDGVWRLALGGQAQRVAV